MKHYALWLMATFWFLPINATADLPDFSDFYQRNKNGNLYSVSPATTPPEEVPKYMRVRNRMLAMAHSHRSYHRFDDSTTNPVIIAHWQKCILLQQNGEYQMLAQQKKALESQRKNLWFPFGSSANELDAKIKILENILNNPITRQLGQIKRRPLEEAENIVDQIGKQWPYNLRGYIVLGSGIEDIQNYYKQVGFDEFAAAQLLLESRPDYKQKKSFEQQLEVKKNNIKKLLDTQWVDLDQAVMEYEEDDTLCTCNHDFLSQRIAAYHETKESPVYTQKNYSITNCVTQALHLHGLQASSYQWLYGNQLQHAIHQECIGLLEHILVVPPDNAVHAYQDGLVDCIDAARDCNQSGLVLNAMLIADFCWALFDCGKAIVEGAVAGAVGAVWDCIEHPVLTAACIAAGKYVLAFQVTKAIFRLVELDFKYSRHPELIVPDWKEFSESIAQTVKEIEKKQISLRDCLKGATQFGAHWLAQHKILGGLGKLYKTAQLKAMEFAQKNPWTMPQHYMATPEGSVVKVLRSEGINVPDKRAKASMLNAEAEPTIDRAKIKLDLKPLGLGSTGRAIPANLHEKLALEEIISDPKMGRIIKLDMADKRWPKADGWRKMVWEKKISKKERIEIHYVAQWKDGSLVATDDFKFKYKQE